MPNRNPLISIYIPTHNRADLLDRAIKSVLKQTYQNIEIIVCSDGSTDSTDVLMNEYCLKFDNIKYVKNNTAQGACRARNKAIAAANGTYVTGLDDDDYFKENRIYDFVQKIKESDLLFSRYEIKHSNGVRYYGTNKASVELSDMLVKNHIGNQVFVKKDLLLSIGGFDEMLPAWQDYDVWIRLLRIVPKAINIVQCSYVVDMTHVHERISKNPKKIIVASEIFRVKHKEFRSNNFHLIINKLSNQSVSPTFYDILSIFKGFKLIPVLKMIRSRLR